MSDDLKDCPFCGNPSPEMWGEGGSLGRRIWRVCTSCGAQGPKIMIGRNETDAQAHERASEAWNERVGTEQPRNVGGGFCSNSVSNSGPDGYENKGNSMGVAGRGGQPVSAPDQGLAVPTRGQEPL